MCHDGVVRECLEPSGKARVQGDGIIGACHCDPVSEERCPSCCGARPTVTAGVLLNRLGQTQRAFGEIAYSENRETLVMTVPTSPSTMKASDKTCKSIRCSFACPCWIIYSSPPHARTRVLTAALVALAPSSRRCHSSKLSVTPPKLPCPAASGASKSKSKEPPRG